MLTTVEAVIEEDGRLRLLEDIDLKRSGRVLVTFLEQEPTEVSETALLSEAVLGADWNRPEEDEAWQHLQ